MDFKKFKKSEKISDIKKSSGNMFGKKAKIVLLASIIILLVGVAGYFLYSNYDKKAQITDANLNADQIKVLLSQVGEKVELPQGETPTIATVTDIQKLQGQQFFKNAQNGDKVIIYQSTQKAILYRPSTGKVVDISPINLNNNQSGASSNANVTPQPSGTITPSPSEAPSKIKVTVLNSTQEVGLAKKGANLLDDEKYEIVSTSNATGGYDKTTVSIVNKTNAKSSDASAIVKSLSKVGATIVGLPSDESAPAGVDIVIILGNDFAEAY